MFMYNCIGKTLEEIAKETTADFHNGYSVFVLQNESDTTGKEIATSYSVKAILTDHPEIANYIVKFENDFFGTTVLRVGQEISIKETEVYKEFDILLYGKVIGSAEIKYPEMTLNNFNILPQYQGKGYGQKAIKKFVDDFGVTNLWVSPENEIAKHIYEKNGFTTDDNPLFVAMRLKGGIE